MNNQQNNNFVNGLFVNYQQTQYGTIVKQAFHVQRFIEWLQQQQQNEKGYVKVDILTKQDGTPYCKLNTYQAPQQQQYQQQMAQPQYQQPPMQQAPQPVQQPMAQNGNMGHPQQTPMPPVMQQNQQGYKDETIPFL